MKNIKEFILESKQRGPKITLEQFLTWYALSSTGDPEHSKYYKSEDPINSFKLNDIDEDGWNSIYEAIEGTQAANKFKSIDELKSFVESHKDDQLSKFTIDENNTHSFVIDKITFDFDAADSIKSCMKNRM